jgi:hypothetical protein
VCYNSSRDEIYEKNSRIKFGQIKKKKNTQITKELKITPI